MGLADADQARLREIEMVNRVTESLGSRFMSKVRIDPVAYDEDVGHEPREFLDEEDWGMVEREAHAALSGEEEKK